MAGAQGLQHPGGQPATCTGLRAQSLCDGCLWGPGLLPGSLSGWEGGHGCISAKNLAAALGAPSICKGQTLLKWGRRMLLRFDTRWLVTEIAVDPAYQRTALYLQGCACDWQLIC